MTLMVTWLWQGTAIACLTLLLLRARPQLSAATRHLVWWCALGAVLLLPVAHLMAAALDPTPPGFARAGNSLLILPPIDGSLLVAAVILWACFAALGLIRVIRAWRALSRLKGASHAFDASREAQLPTWMASRMSGRRPQLRTNAGERPGACALGLGAPAVILVSRSLADALDDAELDDIVMHESAHLERRDDWLRLLQVMAGSLAGFHPAVRFIARQIDVEREAACDDLVVARADARRYARALILAAAAAAPQGSGLAPAASGPKAGLLRFRIARLLDPRRNGEVRPHLATSMACAVALASALLTAPRLTPLVGFARTIPRASAPPPLAPAPDLAPAAEVQLIPGDRPPSLRIVGARARHVGSPASTLTPVPIASLPIIADATSSLLPLPPLESRRISSAAVLVPSMWPSAVPAPAAEGGTVSGVQPWSVAAGSATAAAASATAAAIDAARAAESLGARASNAGLSIGRIATRAGVGLASGF